MFRASTDERRKMKYFFEGLWLMEHCRNQLGSIFNPICRSLFGFRIQLRTMFAHWAGQVTKYCRETSRKILYHCLFICLSHTKHYIVCVLPKQTNMLQITLSGLPNFNHEIENRFCLHNQYKSMLSSIEIECEPLCILQIQIWLPYSP